MKKTRHAEEQIALALKQTKTGTLVAEVIHRMGISEQTFRQRKKVYSGLGVGELRRLEPFEEENRRFKQLVADLSVEKHILQDVPPWRQRATQLPGVGRRPVVGALRVASAGPGTADAPHP